MNTPLVKTTTAAATTRAEIQETTSGAAFAPEAAEITSQRYRKLEY